MIDGISGEFTSVKVSTCGDKKKREKEKTVWRMAFLTAFVKLVLGMTPSCQLSKLVCFFLPSFTPSQSQPWKHEMYVYTVMPCYFFFEFWIIVGLTVWMAEITMLTDSLCLALFILSLNVCSRDTIAMWFKGDFSGNLHLARVNISACISSRFVRMSKTKQ